MHRLIAPALSLLRERFIGDFFSGELVEIPSWGGITRCFMRVFMGVYGSFPAGVFSDVLGSGSSEKVITLVC